MLLPNKRLLNQSSGTPGLVREIRTFLGAARHREMADYIAQLRCVNGNKDLSSALRTTAGAIIGKDDEERALKALYLVISDLWDQGWDISVDKDKLTFSPPGLAAANGESIDEIKARIRRALRVGRDRQLQEPSVRNFLRRMERPVKRRNGVFSVLSLVDDGVDLATTLEAVQDQADKEDVEHELRKLIRPEILICEAGIKCQHTGLDLMDIWRYFRHTWSLEYRPIPGRQLPILIRNRGRPRSPVIGLGLLASPVMRSSVRDEWIGWTRSAFLEKVMAGLIDAKVAARALITRIDKSIAEIRWDDFVKREEIDFPNWRVIFRLEQRAAGAAEKRANKLRENYEKGRRGRSAASGMKSGVILRNVKWVRASANPLFVRKRAETLAKLLRAKLAFRDAHLSRKPDEAIRAIAVSSEGQRALDVVLAEFRKYGLSSQVADVSVCGAIHPYNEILGGKLVALLLLSAEVQKAYRERYSGQVSVIASQMAGRIITKPPELRVLTTTSLYGVGSSQYNRLRLEAGSYRGLRNGLNWYELPGKTAGYGSVHLSQDTVHALRMVSESVHGARRVNNVFGEGTSPRLRQIREGLEILGVRSDDVLHHATPRIFYAAEIVPGVRHVLIGCASGGKVVPPRASFICNAWIARWLARRIRRPETIDRLRNLGPDSVRAQLWADESGQYKLPFAQTNPTARPG